MAQGDAVSMGAQIWNAGTVEFRPSTGVEWCITGIAGSSYTQVHWMHANSTYNDNTSGNSQSYAEGNKSAYSIKSTIKWFFTRDRYFKIRGTNANSSYHYGHVFGIQSK